MEIPPEWFYAGICLMRKNGVEFGIDILKMQNIFIRSLIRDNRKVHVG